MISPLSPNLIAINAPTLDEALARLLAIDLRAEARHDGWRRAS